MIKLVVMDVDGTLTNGRIVYGDGDLELKGFDVRDGLAVKALGIVGIPVVMLTGRKSEAVLRRGKELDCVVLSGVSDKLSALSQLCEERSVPLSDVIYIGDDLNDYSAMKVCGMSGCPFDASREVVSISGYVSPSSGGSGAVRDVLEHYLREYGLWDKVLEFYGVMLR